jgi:hypothetical protein
VPVRERLRALLDELEPFADSLGAAQEFAFAREMTEANGAMRVRDAAGGDPRGAARWLTDRFLDGC